MTANGSLLYSTESSVQHSVMTQRGGIVEAVGGRSKRKGIHVYI